MTFADFARKSGAQKFKQLYTQPWPNTAIPPLNRCLDFFDNGGGG